MTDAQRQALEKCESLWEQGEKRQALQALRTLVMQDISIAATREYAQFVVQKGGIGEYLMSLSEEELKETFAPLP